MQWLTINVALIFTGGYLALHPGLLPQVLRCASLQVRSILLFSALGALSMFFHFEPEPGVIVDLRMAVVGASGWLTGWTVSIPVAAAVALVRLLMGGEGALAGFVHITIAGVVGALFYRRPRNLLHYAVFGIACAAGVHLSACLLEGVSVFHGMRGFVYPLYALLSAVAAWLLHWVFWDTDARRQLQESLQKELRLNEAVLEMVPAGVVVVDKLYRIRKVNRQAGALLDLNESHIGELLTERLPEEVERELHRRTPPIQVRVGAERRVLVYHGEPLPEGGWLISAHDVTHVVREEREDAHRKRLEVAGELAAMAAHEIKNPLTTIKGFLQILSTKPEFERYGAELGLLEGEVEQINRVVTDFLVLARYHPDDFQAVDVGELTAEVRTLVGLQYPDATVATTMAIESGLSVWSDRKALKQVLLNLFVNAYDAMEGNGSLQASGWSDSEFIHITVADSGPGILPELREQVFLPYVTTKPHGTGLGLTICSRLITEMGGDIWVEDQEGPGAAFHLRLPKTVQQQQGGRL